MERPVFDSSRRETASAVDAMVRKIQFHFFRKNLQLFIKSQSFTATLQSLPDAQQLHFVLQTTLLTPEMSQEPTAVAGGRDLLRFDFRRTKPVQDDAPWMSQDSIMHLGIGII